MKNLLSAWRSLRREPDVSALIVLVLVLGIGGNSAIFNLLEATHLWPAALSRSGPADRDGMEFREPERRRVCSD